MEGKISDEEIISGLERLAFGRTNDAAALVFSEEVTPQRIIESDFFNVSEIKKVKGGGIEIKFFDRQKALERLWDYKEKIHSRSNAMDLAKALNCNDSEEISDEDSPLCDDENE